MDLETLVFEDSTTDLNVLVEHALAAPIDLASTDVRQPGMPSETSDDGDAAEAASNRAPVVDRRVATGFSERVIALSPDSAFGSRREGTFEEEDDERKGLFEAGFLDMSLSGDFDLREFLDKAKQSVGRKLGVKPCGIRDLLSVRRDDEGYVIDDVDLLAYARSCEEPPCDLILTLPSSIDGVPVYRISANAFKQRFVHGVEVRALIVPSSVRHLEKGALSALSVRDVFIGSGLTDIWPQPLVTVRTMKAPARRRFHIDAGNPAYRTCEGSIYTSDMTALVSYALPCPDLIELPEGLRHIMSGSLETASEAPRRVVCPDALERVDGPLDHSLLWVCDSKSALAGELREDGAVTLTREHVSQDGFFYDVRDDGQAYLVQSPYTCDRVSLPAYLGDKPLVRIEPGALPRKMISLTIPDTVTEIGEGNICGTLIHLSLGEGVRRIGQGCFRSRLLEGVVHIPRSVTSIGRTCFENSVCLLEACGCLVHAPSDGLLDCFSTDDCGRGDGIPFDFERYDGVIVSERYVPDKVGAILERLMHPYLVAEGARARFSNWMSEHETETLERVARIGDAKLLEVLCDMGFLGADNIDQQIELLRQMNRTDCVILLMDRRRKMMGTQKSARERFAL